MNDTGYEPVPGLPESLPPGEAILWQGTPAWPALARRAYRVTPILAYFAVLMAWRLTGDAAGKMAAELQLAGLALAAAAVLCLLAWLSARATIYTITNRRVVMRIGVAVPISLNLPFAMIDRADLCTRRDGSGDIWLTLARGQRAAYLMLWPHARPWRFARPQPALRGVRDPLAAARILARALAAATAQSAPVIDEAEAARGVKAGPAAAAV